MTLENILIHAEVLKEDEFKRMNFQLYGKIGYHHGVYVKGDQYYLIRHLDKLKESKRYMILEIYDKKGSKREGKVHLLGDGRDAWIDKAKGFLKDLDDHGQRTKPIVNEVGIRDDLDFRGKQDKPSDTPPFYDGDAFDILNRMRESGL